MKILLIALLLIVTLNFTANSQTTEPRTVTDFYMQMPASIINIAPDNAQRRKRIAIEDAANGYLKLKPESDESPNAYTEIAIFKKTSGGYVIGVGNVTCTDICGNNPK